MGYYSQVGVTTTKKGWEKIQELAPKFYAEAIEEYKKKGATDSKFGDGYIELGNRLYYKEFDLKPQKVTEKDGNVLLTWDYIKWIGYDFEDKKAYQKAFEECGEFVRECAVGEDGMEEMHEYNDDKEPENFPYVGTYSGIDLDAF